MPVSVTIIKGGQSFRLEDFGVACKRHDIPPLPEKEDYTIQVPGRAGKIRMGAQYKERSFYIECLLMADDPMVDYQMRLAAVAELLDMISEPAYWIFGDMPGKRWQAEYTGSMTIEKMIFDGQFTIPLVSYSPWPETVTDISSGWEYGQGYTYGMGLRYGDKYSFQVTASPTSFEVYNPGNVPLPPIMIIQGQFTNLSIKDGRGNDLWLNWTNGVSDKVAVDCEKGTVMRNDQNMYRQTNKTFFELTKGATTITVSGIGAMNCTVTFSPFRPKYLY